MQRFLTLAFMAWFFISGAFFLAGVATITLLTGWFDKNRVLAHYWASAWGNFYFWTNPFWRFRIDGREYIDARKTYVLVANHQSYMDILCLYSLFKPYKWVSKEEIFKVPIIGPNMKLNQYVQIKRGDLKSIKEMMNVCKGWLERGSSLMMFPEGTRSLDGEIHQFRDGAFRLACEMNVPVIPILVDGTHTALPKGGKYANFTVPIRVKVLPPIDPKQFNNKSAELRNYVHDLMVRTLAEMRSSKQAQHRAIAGAAPE